ncbi:hypothetical protein [Ottowia sp. VDI28]|uniref:hypothetical protein n=1 Tax=Ottowia sp. VDI28 TaxID=3133968 RepID=UPI003C2FB9AF
MNEKQPFQYAQPRNPENHTVEMRMRVPKYIVDAFDAVSIARRMERYELVLMTLKNEADQWLHEASLLTNGARSNPLLADTEDATNG